MGEKIALSLCLTLILELSFAFMWGLRRLDLVLVAVMNILTNPLVVLWNYFTARYGYAVSILFPEAIAIAIEVLLLRFRGKNIKCPILLGVIINVFSYNAGLILEYLLRRLIV